MAKLQKYLFDMDFGAPPRPAGDPYSEQSVLQDEDGQDYYEPQVEEEPPPPPPTFSEEDLQLARDQAFEAGRTAGIQEAESMTERLLAMAEQSMADGLFRVQTLQAEANDQLMRDAVMIAVAVLKKLQPEMIRHHGLDEVEGLLHECLSHLDGEVKVTVRAHPDMLDAVRDRAEQVAQAVAFDGKLVYAADPRIVEGDCRVEWGDGGAERDLARTWTEIETVLARALGMEEETADNQSDGGEAA
ncbi:MAG TPA: FliH/SctL family protein [Candidatus Sulfotelmatobacter sp.]|jgi:flagellar assembly protein FliH|nr:FliH/SctL family protein [Candidatus Sulfotelmatobacter sp.]